jgi:hypothetical protein
MSGVLRESSSRLPSASADPRGSLIGRAEHVLVVAGLGGLGELPGWWKAPGLAGIFIGVVLVQSGVRRALRQRDSRPREPRPRTICSRSKKRPTLPH